MSSFDDAFDAFIGNGGGFSNNPADPGGERCGAPRRALRAAGYTGQMKDLPRDTLKAIAKTLYWDPLRLDELDARVAFQMFDAN